MMSARSIEDIQTLVTNGFSHPYHLAESIFIFRGIRSIVFIFISFFANRIAPDGTPRFAASHMGLFCLPTFHKKDAKLIWVKTLLGKFLLHLNTY